MIGYINVLILLRYFFHSALHITDRFTFFDYLEKIDAFQIQLCVFIFFLCYGRTDYILHINGKILFSFFYILESVVN